MAALSSTDRSGDEQRAPVREGVVGCVIDPAGQPACELEVFRWFISLTRLAGVSPRDLKVSVVGPPRGPVLDHLRSHGVCVAQVPRFDERHPPCNKISGALCLDDAPAGHLCVLTDSDVVFFEDPRRVPVPSGHVGMRPIDIERPALDTLRRIFAAAELTPPPTVPVGWEPGARTLAGNGNGGFYLIPAELLATVAQDWARWSTWLLDRDLLPRRGPRTMCTDQVAMALALAERSIQVFHLDPRWNLPTHIATSDPPTPAMLHYHGAVSADGEIRATGNPVIDDRIAQANALVADTWHAAFVRRATTLASGTELTTAPELLRRYCDGVRDTPRATLAIVADDDDLPGTFDRLSATLIGIGIDPDGGPDMVIVAASSDLSALEPAAILSQGDRAIGALRLPRWSDEQTAA